MITKEKISSYLNQIIKEKNLDINKELSWGLFFTHYESATLKIAKQIFLMNQHEFVEIIEEDGIFHLHLEEIRVHTVDSLYKKCLELYFLSQELGIDEFNGFDVEDINFAN